MGLYRPESFDEIIGHRRLIQLIRNRLISGTFPQATLFYGEEGIGKTTLIKLIATALNCESPNPPCCHCAHCEENIERVIRNNQDTDNIKTFKMSVDGGLETAKQVRAYLNLNLLTSGCRVIDLEECHRMSNAAQDVLLSDIEFLPKGVYVIASTTDLSGLQKSFQSRFVPYSMSRLTMREMVEVLSNEAQRRHLVIQGGNVTLELIAQWAEFKPRLALKALEAFGESCNVSMEDVKDFISYLDTKQVLPIISSFGASIQIGIKAINELPIDINSYNSLLSILEETLKICMHQKFSKFSREDASLIKEAVENIDTDIILRFLYEVANMGELNRNKLLAAYLSCHPALHRIQAKNPDILNMELTEMHNNAENEIASNVGKIHLPSMDELLREGSILQE